MSGWRTLVIDMAAAGDPVDARAIAGHWAVDQARAFGFVRLVRPGAYVITDLGREFAAGRLAAVERRGHGQRGRKGLRLVATWLRSLPQGLRIEARPQEA